jgi:hypothetical protein
LAAAALCGIPWGVLSPELSPHELEAKLRSEVDAVPAADLLPHHRRRALFFLTPDLDLIEAAMAVARDEATRVSAWVSSGAFRRPTLAELADACVDPDARYQLVIVQPYVLAQRLPR